jgi:hypothetical protein
MEVPHGNILARSRNVAEKNLPLQGFELQTYRNKKVFLTTAPLLGSVILTGNTFLMVV